MKVIGYVSAVKTENKPGRDGRSDFSVTYVEVEGMRLQLKPGLPLPEVNREIEGELDVKWHNGGGGNGDGRAWASYHLLGFHYRSAVVA